MKFEIFPISTKRYCSFIPHDLRYFHTHFICDSMAETWEMPPAELYAKSYKPGDFVSWMLKAPVISVRAKEALESICKGLVEFLPFHSIRGKAFFAVNVLCRDPEMPIFKPGLNEVPLVDERFGAVLRDHRLTGIALADPANNIMRRVIHGQSLHDFPGLVG